MAESEDHVENALTSNIYYTSNLEHFIEIVKGYWRLTALVSLSVFGAIWTLFESSSYFLRTDLSGPYIYGAIGLFSVISSFIYSWRKYLKETPNGLEKESLKIQKIARIKKPYWEYSLAHALLSEKLSALDERLNNVLEGKEFIKLTKKPKTTEYIEWVILRPINLEKMVEVAKKLLIFDLPSVLQASEEPGVSPTEILKCIERIEKIYQQTCEYEIEAREIEPPENFTKIHEILNGWSVVIRNAINQMINFLEKMSNLKETDISEPIEFQIVFEEPNGVKELEEELAKAEKNLPVSMFKEFFT